VPRGVALATNFRVCGDFEITVSYEILKADRPSTGYGVGVSLYAAINPDTNDAVSLARRIHTDGTIKFVSDRITPGDPKPAHKWSALPSVSPSGKLRLQRVGSKVRCLVAEGDNPEFALVDEGDICAAEGRYV